MDDISIRELDTWTLCLSRICPICGNVHEICVNKFDYFMSIELYKAGTLVQHAFSNFTNDEREFVITGICPTCWDNICDEGSRPL